MEALTCGRHNSPGTAYEINQRDERLLKQMEKDGQLALHPTDDPDLWRIGLPEAQP
jgi:hypothetical protein